MVEDPPSNEHHDMPEWLSDHDVQFWSRIWTILSACLGHLREHVSAMFSGCISRSSVIQSHEL